MGTIHVLEKHAEKVKTLMELNATFTRIKELLERSNDLRRYL